MRHIYEVLPPEERASYSNNKRMAPYKLRCHKCGHLSMSHSVRDGCRMTRDGKTPYDNK